MYFLLISCKLERLFRALNKDFYYYYYYCYLFSARLISFEIKRKLVGAETLPWPEILDITFQDVHWLKRIPLLSSANPHDPSPQQRMHKMQYFYKLK